MSKKIIVTGVNGFVGHHVATRLNDKNYQVIGIGNQQSLDADLVGIVDQYIYCDLTNAEEVKNIDLSDIIAIINLAGFAKIGSVPEDQNNLYDIVNIGVHSTIYEECINQNASPRIIAVSTGAVYDPNQQLPLTEDAKLAEDYKSNPYIISKKKAENVVFNYAKRGLKCIVVRPFNHSGLGQLPGFLLPDLSEQIETAVQEDKPLQVGNLDTKRDFTDVRDVADAYIELATCPEEKLKHQVYNICTGVSISGRQLLKMLEETYGVGDIPTEVDLTRIRKNEILDIYGSRDLITQDIGWEPKISVKQMVEDFVSWKKSK